MKNILSAIMAAAALVTLTSCEDETKTEVLDTPYVTFSTASITLSAEAVSSYTVSYTVGNPIDGATVSAYANVSWISTPDTSTSGQIRFSVAENTSDDLRVGNVTLSYIYNGGSATATIAVVQYRHGDTVLSVNPNAMTVSGNGGSYSFGYSVENQVDGEEVKCMANVDWLSEFDCSTSGTVKFTVDVNSDEKLRTGIITVAYANLSKQVTIIQDHTGSGTVDVDLSEFVGTYSCSGIVYNMDWDGTSATSPGISENWTMKIYDLGDGRLLVSGLTPNTVDYYPYGDYENGPYTAYATVSGDDIIISVPQSTGWNAELTGIGTVYVWWVPCVAYYDTDSGQYNAGWYYTTDSLNCTFAYNNANGNWTSDYGLYLAFGTNASEISPSTMASFNNVFAPGMTITKTSDTTGLAAAPTSLKSLEEIEFRTGAMLYWK